MKQTPALSLISLAALTSTAFPSAIARRLGERVRSHVRLRAMLCDYLYGIRPGSCNSLLCGAADAELEAIRRQLARHLAGAIRDVAEHAEPRFGDGLTRLAIEIEAAIDPVVATGDAAEVVKEWIAISRLAGTTEIEFLQICQ